MPFYDYRCEDCGAMEVDVLFQTSDLAVDTIICGQCGGTMQRQFPLTQFIGWERMILNRKTFNPEKSEDPVTGAEYSIRYCESVSGTSRHEMNDGSNPDPRGEPLQNYYRKRSKKRKYEHGHSIGHTQEASHSTS